MQIFFNQLRNKTRKPSKLASLFRFPLGTFFYRKASLQCLNYRFFQCRISGREYPPVTMGFASRTTRNFKVIKVTKMRLTNFSRTTADYLGSFFRARETETKKHQRLHNEQPRRPCVSAPLMLNSVWNQNRAYVRTDEVLFQEIVKMSRFFLVNLNINNKENH